MQNANIDFLTAHHNVENLLSPFYAPYTLDIEVYQKHIREEDLKSCFKKGARKQGHMVVYRRIHFIFICSGYPPGLAA